MFSVFLFCVFYLFAMMPQQRGRDHVEAALQAVAGEDEVVITMVLGFQATDEEPLAAPAIAPSQHLSSTGAENHQTVTIDQELIRPDSQTSSMDTLADDSYWIVREAWPLKSLNLSNGAEEQHYTSNYDNPKQKWTANAKHYYYSKTDQGRN
ncbi:hypothetical protein Sjap_024091 [Stephania japonica]|uniref:Uncharacterized protein n=1 Tax=Stephania japonica TaxID=461633 RepID=A0AAP0HL60_9MAGN